MTTLETYTVDGQGVTVSLMVWRRFKRPMPGMVERILEINNGVADLGSFLPIGTQVIIPIDPPVQRAQSVPVVQLWDDV